MREISHNQLKPVRKNTPPKLAKEQSIELSKQTDKSKTEAASVKTNSAEGTASKQLHREVELTRVSKTFAKDAASLLAAVRSAPADVSAEDTWAILSKASKLLTDLPSHLSDLTIAADKSFLVKASITNMDSTISDLLKSHDGLVAMQHNYEIQAADIDDITPMLTTDLSEQIADVSKQYNVARNTLRSTTDDVKSALVEGYSQINGSTHDRKLSNMHKAILDKNLQTTSFVGRAATQASDFVQKHVLPTAISKSLLMSPAQPHHTDSASSLTRASNIASMILNFETEGDQLSFSPRLNESVSSLLQKSGNLDEATKTELTRFEELAGKDQLSNVETAELATLSKSFNEKAYDLKKDQLIDALVQNLRQVGISVERDHIFDDNGIPFDAQNAIALKEAIDLVRADISEAQSISAGPVSLSKAETQTKVAAISSFPKSYAIMDSLGLANRGLEDTAGQNKLEKRNAILSGNLTPAKMKEGLERALAHELLTPQTEFKSLTDLTQDKLSNLDINSASGQQQLAENWGDLVEHFARTINDEALLNVGLAAHESRAPIGVLSGLASTLTRKPADNILDQDPTKIAPFSQGQTQAKTEREVEATLNKFASAYQSQKIALEVQFDLVGADVDTALNDAQERILSLPGSEEVKALADDVKSMRLRAIETASSDTPVDADLQTAIETKSTQLETAMRDLWDKPEAQAIIKDTFENIEGSIEGLKERTGVNLKVNARKAAVEMLNVVFNKMWNFKSQTASFTVFPVFDWPVVLDGLKNWDPSAPALDLNAPPTRGSVPTTSNTVIAVADIIGTAGGAPNKMKSAVLGTKSLIDRPGQLMAREDAMRQAESKLAQVDTNKSSRDALLDQVDIEKQKLIIKSNDPKNDTAYDRFFEWYNPAGGANGAFLLSHGVARQSDGLRAQLFETFRQIPAPIADKLGKHSLASFAVAGPISYGTYAWKEQLAADTQFNKEVNARNENLSEGQLSDRTNSVNQLHNFLKTNKEQGLQAAGAAWDVAVYSSALIPMFVKPTMNAWAIGASFMFGPAKDTLSLLHNMGWNAVHDTTSERLASFLTDSMPEEDVSKLMQKVGVENEADLTGAVVSEIAARDPSIILDGMVGQLRTEIPWISQDDAEAFMDVKSKLDALNTDDNPFFEQLEQLKLTMESAESVLKQAMEQPASDIEQQYSDLEKEAIGNELLATTEKLSSEFNEISQLEDRLEDVSKSILAKQDSSTANFLTDLGMKPSQLVAIAASSPSSTSDSDSADVIKMQLNKYFKASYFGTG